MVTLISDTEPKQEMRDALVANGLTVSDPVKPEETAKPVEDKTKSEPEGEPGEKIPAETEGKSAATTEVVEDKSQETPQVEEGKPKPKGGFQAKVEKLTAKADRLMEELEEERGSKTALQRQLDAVNAELAALKPAEAKVDEGPVKPKRPKRSDVEFDEDRYEALMDKYEDEMNAYYVAVADKKAQEAVSGYEVNAQAARAEAAYRERIRISAKDIPDYDEVIARLPTETDSSKIELPAVVRGYIMSKTEHPAALMHFLAKDYLDNDGEELARLSKLDEYDQLIEIREIETRLVGEQKTAKKAPKEPTAPKTEPEPVKTAPVAVAKPEVVPPVKEKPKAEALDEPISPVGTRATGRQQTMAELAELAAGGDKAARKLLNEQVTAIQSAKHNGRSL